MKYFLSFLLMIAVISCSKKMSESEYYNKANEAYSAKDILTAVDNFKKQIETYPKGENYSKAVFMLGYIHANDLKKYDEARKYYNEFIEKFPNDTLVSAAKYELETMGQDINTLPMFKNLNKSDSGKTVNTKP